jgi:hypothetical protein
MRQIAMGRTDDRVFRADGSETVELRDCVQQIGSASLTELRLSNDASVGIPQAIVGPLRRIATCLALGAAVVIDPYDEVLTTQEAADLLHVSRPHLINALLKEPGGRYERGDGIPFYWAGRHRRIRLSDVESYLTRRSDRMSSSSSVDLARMSSSSSADLAQVGKELLAEVMNETGLGSLESAISDPSSSLLKVRDALQHCAIYALGQPAGELLSPDRHTDSDLLHFTIDDSDGHEVVMLPVFTRLGPMRDALLRNPEWQALSVLQVAGRDLLENVDDDVIIVVNPWSELEYQVPLSAPIDAGGQVEQTPRVPVDDWTPAHPLTFRPMVEVTVVPSSELVLAR